MISPLDQIADHMTRAWEPEFSGHIWQWADGLEMPGSAERGGIFHPEDSPWLLPVFEAFGDPRVHEVVFLAPAGAAKTMLLEIIIAWIVKNDPARTYLVCQTDDDAKDTMEDRVLKTLGANAAHGVIMPTDRNKKRAMKVVFPGMELYAMGANENNAQAKRVKYLLMDETHAYDAGLLEAFRSRQNTVTGAKCLIISTGCVTGDQTDEAFKASDMGEFFVRCPSCGRAQPMVNKRLRYETSDRTVDAEGNFRMDALASTIRYHCEFERECGAHWEDTDETRLALLQGATYVPQNPSASSGIRGFHLPFMPVHWLKWRKGVAKWLAGNRAAKMGILDERREYIQKWLAESWDESPREEDRIYGGHRKGNYSQRSRVPGTAEIPWDQELTRFCTADQQQKELYAVCKAWAADGSSRTVDAARLTTFEEYEQFRRDNRTEPARTGIDIAYEMVVTQQRCAQYGWTGLWGDERRQWPHDQRSPLHPRNIRGWAGVVPAGPVMLPISPPMRTNANQGFGGKSQVIRYYYWSNPSVKDIWHYLYEGLGASFTHAEDIHPLYLAHCDNEIKILEFDKGTGRKSKWKWVVPNRKSTDEKKQDHYLDADQMNLALALMDPRISLIQAILGGASIATPELTLEEA